MIIFSYPVSVDKVLKLEEYIIYNNNINFEVDLNNEIKIENNIFGLVFAKTIINAITIIGKDYKIYSSKYETIEIIPEYSLESDENITIKYEGTLKYYDIFEAQIEFYYNISEPELEKYDEYPEAIEGDNDIFFEQKLYKGRINRFQIMLTQQITSHCCDNTCDLCYRHQKAKCLICKNASLIKQLDLILYRECSGMNTTFIDNNCEEETEVITESIIVDNTEKNTEIVLQSIINDNTEKNIEIITDSIINNNTEKYTDMIIETPSDYDSDENTEKNTEIVTDIISNENTNKINETFTNNISDEENETSTSIISNNIIQKETDIMTYKNSDEYTNEIKEEEKSCNKENIIKSKYCEFSVTDEQLQDIYVEIKNTYINKDYNGNNTIFYLNNAIFQISTNEDQKNSEDINISNIDLGPCEERLKKSNNIPDKDSLIIYKVDIKYPDNHCTYVKYEVYNPINLTLLDLSICKDVNIVINTPVDLDDKTLLLYDNLRKSGFDLFNESDDFYNDPCTTYTSINNTDITLDDRKQLFLNNSANVTLCQSGCQMNYYN